MRQRLAQLHQSGASNGEVPVWDNALGQWVPGAGSGGSGSSLYVNVVDEGLIGDDATDNSAAITAMVTAHGIHNVTYYFPPGTYRTSTAWPTLSQSSGFRFLGDGYRGQGNFVDINSKYPTARLVYTGTGSTAFINARSSWGLTIDGLSIAYSSGSFTGDLIDLSALSNPQPTAFTRISSASLTAVSSAVFSAHSILYIDGMVELTIDDCTIGWAVNGILCKPTSGSSAGYCNAVTITGGRIGSCSTAGIRFPGEQFTLTGVVFEPYSSTATGIVGSTTYPVAGMTLVGCGFWDGSSGGYWMDLWGEDVAIFGGWMDIAQPSATLVRVNGSFDGLTIKGFSLGSGTLYAIAGGATLTNDDIGPGVPTTRTITAGTGLTGGGDLSANRTITADIGTSGSQVAAGNHTHTSSGSELLMADGVTAPPVPIENEAQDDWLYAD